MRSESDNDADRLAQAAPVPEQISIEDQVYDRLRALIVMELRPGTALRLDEIARQLNVSTMPVRGALTRLAGENLVIRVGRRKAAVVAPLDLEDLRDIQAIRCGLEGYAAYAGALAIQPKNVEAMVKTLDRLRTSVSGERPLPLAEYLERQYASHLRCFAAAGHQQLLRQIDQWRRAAERYILRASDVDSMLTKDLEFETRLVRACEIGDGRLAEESVRGMLEWVTTQFEVWLHNQPEEHDDESERRARDGG